MYIQVQDTSRALITGKSSKKVYIAVRSRRIWPSDWSRKGEKLYLDRQELSPRATLSLICIVVAAGPLERAGQRGGRRKASHCVYVCLRHSCSTFAFYGAVCTLTSRRRRLIDWAVHVRLSIEYCTVRVYCTEDEIGKGFLFRNDYEELELTRLI